MAKGTTVSLVDSFSKDRGLVAFVDKRVQSGNYDTATEVLWAALRLLEDHEKKVKSLQDELIAGEKSGDPKPFDFEDFKARKRAAASSSDA